MVRITLQYPNLPLLLIDSDVNECARLLQLLASGELKPIVQQAKKTPPPEKDTKQDPPKTVVPNHSSPHTTERDTEVPGQSGRLYGGKRNRRDMILEVFEALHEEGQPLVSLADLRNKFQSLYPQEDQNHLDQVIRDLSNKTDLVVREGRGLFRLG